MGLRCRSTARGSRWRFRCRAEAAGWKLLGHGKYSSYLKRTTAIRCETKWVVAVCGFADRGYEEPGRPGGLPHTATIKQTTGAEALIVVFMMLGYTRIVRAAKPYRRSMPATGRTISGDVAGRNGAVGLTPDLEVDAWSMWEPGLPAMAVCQAPRIVADVPPSRASPGAAVCLRLWIYLGKIRCLTGRFTHDQYPTSQTSPARPHWCRPNCPARTPPP